MQYSRKFLTSVTSVVFALVVTLPAFAQTAVKSQVVGVVDRDKIVTNYPKALQAAEELRKLDENIHKLIEDSNKQYEDAKNAKKPPAELEGLKVRLQNQIDSEMKRDHARAQTLESQLENEIDSAIKAEAEVKKVDLVVLRQAVLFGGVDLTDGVAKRLGSVASTTKTTTK